MRTAFVRYAALALMLFAPLTQSWAAKDDNSPVLSRIAETNTLRIGMTGGQPPFNVKNRDGKMIGMEVDLARMLARAMGVELEIVEKPFADLLGALEKGDVDLVMSGMTSTLQRNLRVAFVGPYYVSGKSILTRSETIAAIQNTEEVDKASMRVAALKGSTSEDFVRKAMNSAQLTTTRDYDEAVDKLLSDSIDILVADAPICMLTIMRFPEAGLTTLRKPLTIEPIGIAVPPNDPLLLNLVENYLEAVSATGGLEALRKKWFENGGWLIQLP